MQVKPEGIEDGGIQGAYHSFCFSVEGEGMTGGGKLHMPTGMAETEGGGRTVAFALG
jgi:hypothetical protein